MLFVLVPSLWLTVLTGILAACRMAARADADPPAEAQSPRRIEAQIPRRPTTCGTVRRRIFTSVHKDQFATYR